MTVISKLEVTQNRDWNCHVCIALSPRIVLPSTSVLLFRDLAQRWDSPSDWDIGSYKVSLLLCTCVPTHPYHSPSSPSHPHLTLSCLLPHPGEARNKRQERRLRWRRLEWGYSLSCQSASVVQSKGRLKFIDNWGDHPHFHAVAPPYVGGGRGHKHCLHTRMGEDFVWTNHFIW